MTYKSRPCEDKLKHRSIALPYLPPTEGIQSVSEGFVYYLGPKKATIMPPGGAEKCFFFAITESRRNGMSYKIPIKLIHYGYYS